LTNWHKPHPWLPGHGSKKGAPIGIPIGALTPAEIGVSILAEIIAEKRRLFPAEETNREVLAAAAELEAAGKQGIMVTIVKTRGSTPRKAGARMLVYPGEQVIGTIGGGKGEAAAKGQALPGRRGKSSLPS
jgi:xanthine dehydrogenase accessory factor